MEALIAFILALIMLLTGCGRTKAMVLPDRPAESAESEAVSPSAEAEPWAPETAEERLAFSFAGLSRTDALDGKELLTFEGELNGEPLSYRQEESFVTSALDSRDVTYYREVDYSAGVGDENVPGHYTVIYEGGSLISEFDSGKRDSRKASTDALSRNVIAALTAFTDADAAAHYSVLDQKEDGGEVTVTFTADEEWIYDLIDRSLTLMGEGFDEDLSGSVYAASREDGDIPSCTALLDRESMALKELLLQTGSQSFTLADGSVLRCSASYRLQICARGDRVVPFIPGFS